jgi:hypothetical protein
MLWLGYSFTALITFILTFGLIFGGTYLAYPVMNPCKNDLNTNATDWEQQYNQCSTKLTQCKGYVVGDLQLLMSCTTYLHCCNLGQPPC